MAFVEYYLSHEGEWLLARAERTVAVARVDFDLTVVFRAATPSGEPYLDKLLAAHPFNRVGLRRWAVYRSGAKHGAFIGRNRFEAVKQAAEAGVPPGELDARSEEELGPEAWQAFLDHALGGL